ncbi:hypothetical protein B0I00_1898 [Novosphingobium kunmingense]|uniref:Tail tube GTA-gp10-like protein n=1 Tax=Novosphingobium kunmingense TaxID=1211806 RepID=A0A2N0HL92_9SPHN|nr:hypothetical protein [Novosphingobium kunmingense]PKB19658.1 hypothetical protein B0I00_1898 [Novosphingobium kunmingense]
MSAAHTVVLDAGDHGPLKLVFKFGTLRKAERELGRSLTSAMAEGNIGFDELSAIFWAALQPSLLITRDGSDDLIDAIGVVEVTRAVMEGVSAAFGKGEHDKADDAAAGEAKAAKKAR